MKLCNEILESVWFPRGNDWFIKNGLLGIPLDLIDKIEGDYEGHIDYLKMEIEGKTFDEHGNLRKWRKGPEGFPSEETYDEHGNITRYRSSLGMNYDKVYDEHRNLTYYKDYNTSEEWERDYDELGNILVHRDSDGNCDNYEYK